MKLQGLTGWPDRMVLWPQGIVHFIETKRPVRGKLSLWQVEIHKRLRAMGFTVLLISSKAQVDQYLTRALNERRKT